ncbi:MAG: YdcF family protein [Rhodospirillales bacterium]|nr:YdcF family protein [Rhodospirillales bacterium]
MFFELSKILWWFVDPANLLLAALIVGTVLLWTRQRRLGVTVVSIAMGLVVAVAVLPVGDWMTQALENRFPPLHKLPDKIDGIVALGGVVDPWISKARGHVSLGGTVERLSEFAALASRYPDAKLVFTGGSGRLMSQELKEATLAAPFLDLLGLDPTRLILEDQSRNTYENAVLSRDLVQPKPDETWVLITSAAHMPRAVGCFRQAGWTVIPYPVDFNYEGNEGFGLTFNFYLGLGKLSGATHEWVGLASYWITGRSEALFPGPDSTNIAMAREVRG